MLLRACFRSFKLRIRGFPDLRRKKPSVVLMLFGWRSIFVAFLMIPSMHLDSLAKIMVLCCGVTCPGVLQECSRHSIEPSCCLPPVVFPLLAIGCRPNKWMIILNTDQGLNGKFSKW
jgi:hypothetical protein